LDAVKNNIIHDNNINSCSYFKTT